MKILVDAMLPRRLAERLRELGHDAKHVRGLGQAARTDADIWDMACRDNCLLLSKDAGFLILLKRDSRGKFVHLRTGNASRAQVVQNVCVALPQILDFAVSAEAFLVIKEEDLER